MSRIKLNNKGFTWSEWVLLFAVIIAVFTVLRPSFKRNLQDIIARTGDFLFWTQWNQEPKQQKADVYGITASKADKTNYTRIKERQGSIETYEDNPLSEKSAASSAGEDSGSQRLLRTIDINQVLD